MLKRTSFLVLFGIAVLMACDKKNEDDECVAPAIEKNIVGAWKAVAKADGDTTEPANVEFKADGTLIDVDSALADGNVNGVPLPNKTWKIENGKLVVTARGANAAFITFPGIDIKENQCKKIVLDSWGFGTIELAR